MSHNSFGHLFRMTTWGESHGPALGAVVDGCPPGIALEPAMIQHWLDRRKPGQSKFTTQRREEDEVKILSGVFEGLTTGTPISLMIENTDQRSKDYSEIAAKFRPGHADITYWQKYGIRDYRGGGRSSARETAARVAAGGVARQVLAALVPGLTITGYMVRMGEKAIDRARFDLAEVERNPFWVPDAVAAADWEAYLDALRKAGNSVGAVIEVVASGVPAGLGAPVYGKLDSELAAAMMSINAVKGVEIGDGMAAAELTGIDNADEIRMGNEGPLYLTQPCRRGSGRDILGAGPGGAVRGQADLVDPDPAADDHARRRGDRDRHQGPARSLRRDPGGAGRRGDDGAGAGGSAAAAPRAGRRGRRDDRLSRGSVAAEDPVHVVAGQAHVDEMVVGDPAQVAGLTVPGVGGEEPGPEAGAGGAKREAAGEEGAEHHGSSLLRVARGCRGSGPGACRSACGNLLFSLCFGRRVRRGFSRPASGPGSRARAAPGGAGSFRRWRGPR